MSTIETSSAPVFQLEPEVVPVELGWRAGSFVDNMRLPVHGWYRYSAGFSAEWVEALLKKWDFRAEQTVLDPFAGSGTTMLATDKRGVSSVGIEAHPFVQRIACAKLAWPESIARFERRAADLLAAAETSRAEPGVYPDLIGECYSSEQLRDLHRLKQVWNKTRDDSAASELAWLALTAILRITSAAGTAQWQYILPKRTKAGVVPPFEAFAAITSRMARDMEYLQNIAGRSRARVVRGDARGCPVLADESVDAVITSPPYANNYDYADATRLEMSFWGEVQGWADLHATVRQHLIVACAQHASAAKLALEPLLADAHLTPIRAELTTVVHALAEARLHKGGKKHYHTMVAAYFRDLAAVWRELRRVCRPGARIVWVVGDSAPYGVHVPVERWLGELALAAGFRGYRFEKLRARNIKWECRKHRHPLHEGLLWVDA